MSKIEILTNAYRSWTLFDEWVLASSLVLTDYERKMFQWMAIFSACQKNEYYVELAPDEVVAFLDNMMNGEA